VAIDDVYHPDGFNLGMNLGHSAGAGIADHLHMHLLPRWTGDTNFMTTVAETRLEPEELSVTYTKLRKALAQ
jgi:ATP adenylyltransferase